MFLNNKVYGVVEKRTVPCIHDFGIYVKNSDTYSKINVVTNKW